MSMDAEQLKAKAHELRQTVLEMCVACGGHLASSFSCLDILVALYHGGVLNVRPEAPDDPGRDRFILSKGHAETVLYAVLADRGFFPAAWLRESYRAGDCRLGGHPDHRIPGVEITSGALGHGLGIGAGMAAAAKADKAPGLHVVLMGDAECTEGSVWEAALFASQRGLGNLVGIVDRNGIGSLDYTSNYTGLGDLSAKWRAFGWEVLDVDGHSMDDLLAAFAHARARRAEAPLMLMARTVKGKGVSFVEDDPIWHVKALCDAGEILQARKELGCGCHED